MKINTSKLFKTPSLDEPSSPEFDLFSDLEEHSEEEVARTMTETMEEYMCKTQGDYRSGVTRPKIDAKYHFELKGQFLKELRDNTFNGASVSVMPLPTSLNLGLGELAHTKLTVKLADKIVKHPKGIVENVLVGTAKVFNLHESPHLHQYMFPLPKHHILVFAIVVESLADCFDEEPLADSKLFEVLCLFTLFFPQKEHHLLHSHSYVRILQKSQEKSQKPDKNGHENGKLTQDPGIIKKSQPKSTLVNLGQLTK
nr:hypothetical protein [Tanacetum cinerariifolium]